jgi:4-hydroxy-4-methyl-2-oxoglutarate aldolase
VDAITARLRACYTGVVHDVMRGLGLRGFTFPPALRPLMPEGVLAGPAWTIEGRAEPGADAHATLLEWTGLLSRAPPGHLWVSQPNDDQVAHMGELSAETLKNKGVLGCVVDGFIRDTNFLLAMGFQAWSRGHTPRDIVGYWLPTATEIPIEVAGVTVAPGDYLIGDRDGLLRLPGAMAEEIVARAETAMATENLVRKAILDGVDPQQAYLRYGKF